MSRVRDYRPESYGEAFADVYDDWYHAVSNVDDTVALVDALGPADRPARILELAVGTGRLALPLARRGHAVTGIDISPAMLDVLRSNDPEGLVTTVAGDMVDDLPDGPFDVVLVAYTSLFMLVDPARQAACFAAVAERLGSGGLFVVEAFVPFDPPRPGSDVSLRSMTASSVVLSVSTTDAETQRVDGQFIELTDGAPVRLRPYSLRYSTPDELDGFARRAGLELDQRFEDFARTDFDPETSPRHVSVYRHAITALGR
jgi:SAM-dependent methyltransferase